MSCGSLSPAVSLAMNGMMNGTGIGVPPAVQTSVSSFTSAGPVATAQSALTSSSNIVGNPLDGLGASTLPALTGVVPTSLVPRLADCNINNFAAQINVQATRMMSGGIGGFAQIAASAQGFVASSIDIKGSAMAGSGLTFASLGIGLTASNGASGIISNGLGVQFGSLSNLGTVLGRLNRVYDVRNMQTFGQPDNLVKNLIARGYGKSAGLEDKLEQAGVDLDDMSNPVYTANIRSVLSSIQGTEMNSVLAEAGVTGVSINSLNDLTDITKLGDPTLINSIKPAGASTVPSLNQIGKTFADMGGGFEDATKIASLVKSIETPTFPRMNSYYAAEGGTVIPGNVKVGLDQNTATGSLENFAVKPKIQDLIGSVSGETHVSSLNSMTSVLNSINASPDVTLFNTQMALMKDVADGVYFGGGNAIIDGGDESKMGNVCVIPAGTLTAAGMTGVTVGNITQTLTNMRVYAESTLTTISTNPSLAASLNTLNTNYEKTTKQLALEKTNLKMAGIDPLQPMSGGPNSSSTGVKYDRTYGTAPLTNWSADELYRYWRSLPVVFTGNANVQITSDICRGAMYNSSKLFTNSAAFVESVNTFLESSESKLNANLWTSSLYPEVNSAAFDISSGICYFSNPSWRAKDLTDDRPVGYPITGIPMPEGGVPSNVKAMSSTVAGDKNSIITLATQLHDIGKDSEGTGISTLIESMATDNVYGDAVKAALIEGRNKERLTSAGIVPIVNKLASSTTTPASYSPPPTYIPAEGTGAPTVSPTAPPPLTGPAYIPAGMPVFHTQNVLGTRPTRLTVNIPLSGTCMVINVPSAATWGLSFGWVPTINDPAGHGAWDICYVLNSVGTMIYDGGFSSGGSFMASSVPPLLPWALALKQGNYTFVLKAARYPDGREPVLSQVYIDFF